MPSVHVSAKRSNTEIDDLVDLVDMEDFLNFESIDYRVTRGRSGTQLNLRECPRCGGRDWKVYLNADTGLGSCFHGSCSGEPGFNKYSFIYQLNAKSHKDTVAVLKRYGKSLGWRPASKAARPVDETPSEIELPESYELPIKGRTLKYLSDRGFDADMAAYFGWRFSKNGVYNYTLHGDDKSQDWSNRVVIPVYGIDGELVTFQGRSTEANPFQKYLFPPGIAGAGRFIYNAHNAAGLSEVVLCEGVFDVAAVKKAFDEDITFKDVGICGTFGKHLSMAESGAENDQLSDLKRMRDKGLTEITMMWDGSADAVLAAVKTGLNLRSYGFTVKLAILPLDKDPNEVDTEVVRQAFVKARVLSPLTAAAIVSKFTFSS